MRRIRRKEMIKFIHNNIPYFILGDESLGLLFNDARDMATVENSAGCIENNKVYIMGQLIRKKPKKKKTPRKNKTYIAPTKWY